MKRIKITQAGLRDSEMRFHVTGEISQTNSRRFERPLRPSSDRYLEEVGDAGKTIVETVLPMRGITSVTISPYCLRVEKGSAFDWTWEGTDLKANILHVLLDALGEGYEVVDETLPEEDEDDSEDPKDADAEDD